MNAYKQFNLKNKINKEAEQKQIIDTENILMVCQIGGWLWGWVKKVRD